MCRLVWWNCQTANCQESETVNYTGRICYDIEKSMGDDDVISPA
jgi:hypothetical protein